MSENEQKDVMSKMVENKIFARGYIFLLVMTLIVVVVFCSVVVPYNNIEITEAHAKVMDGTISSLSLAVTFLVGALITKEAMDVIGKFKK